MSTEPQPRMITLAISLYNDFARWSMERCGIAYREERHALVLHTFASRRAGGKGTTPVLIAGDEVVGESALIAEWADRHAAPERKIYPADSEARERARELITHLMDDLGQNSRRILWTHLINDVPLACRYWSDGIPAWEARAQPWALRGSKPLVRRALGLSPAQLEAAPGKVRKVFDEVAGRLEASGPHLGGERLDVTDICFAAMAAPALCPPEGLPVSMPQPEEFSEPTATVMRELREHPAGQYALRLYRDER